MRVALKLSILFISAVLLLPANFVFASTTVTDVYDQPSSLKVSTSSNHRFVFTTSVAIPAADMITITFPSGFDLTSIIEDDVDISDDGIDLTTASDCTGVDQVGFSVSSQSLIFEICAGDGGSIVLGSEVIIEIGTNASAYGSGTNRITNPAGAATYFIWLTSSTNDLFGSVPLPIVSDDDGNVSLSIPASSGGSSPGG
ncbi:MAG: hypothetical protein ACD_66C00109G0008, partial [uncultured bacterium]